MNDNFILRLQNITKSFGDTQVLRGISIDIRQGEFITFLGSSGCGKTTTLRIIAGLEEPDSGAVLLEGRDVTALAPNKRDVNTVFQSYALFPHMTVEQNVAYSLRLKKVPKEEQQRSAQELLELVQLAGYEKRMPSELSGGQRQRVAIARALAGRPRVLLLDEPLGALDLKLRKDMQNELKRIQKAMEITFVYVTHDQEEALAISDRIAVMKEGNIMQIGRPEEIYRKPANPFVANFIGVSNFVDCTVDGQDPKAASVKLHDGYSFQMPLRKPYSGEVILSARPEQLFFSEQGIPGKINMSTFLGDFIQYEVELTTGQVLELNEYTKDVDGAKNDGEEVHISFDPRRVSLYRKDTEEVLSC